MKRAREGARGWRVGEEKVSGTVIHAGFRELAFSSLRAEELFLDVVASLVSPNEAQGLRQLTFHPQQVRSNTCTVANS